MDDFDAVQQDDNDDFDVVQQDHQDVAPPHVVERPKKRRRRRAIAEGAGRVQCAFLCVVPGSVEFCGVWDLWARARVGIDDVAALVVGIVGVVFFNWHLSAVDAPQENSFVAGWQTYMRGKHKRAKLFGYVHYIADFFYALDGVPYPVTVEQINDYPFHMAQWVHDLQLRTFEGNTLEAYSEMHGGVFPSTLFTASRQLADLLIDKSVGALKVIPVRQRLDHKSLVPGFPSTHHVRRWAKAQKLSQLISDAEDADDEKLIDENKILYDVPAGTLEFPFARRIGQCGAEARDAVQIFKHLKFSRHLKDISKADECLQDALVSACASEDLIHTINDQLPDSPRREALRQARLRLDAVTMNVERRYFQNIIQNKKEEIQSIHLYSDGSPVSGAELQGMVMEFCMTIGTIMTVVMPGVMLHFGGTRLIDKAIAFIWSLHLMIGISLEHLQWICDMIQSITSDMGTEIRLVDTPNILRAWLRRRMGIPMELLGAGIDLSSRLFSNAIRISGWSHMFGNLMKHALHCMSNWPQYLQSCRVLCRFFRVESYRKEIIAQLKGVYPDVVTLLKRFTARLAKWRYETMHTVLAALVPLRRLCQDYLCNVVAMLGPHFKETEHLAEVQTACKWGELCIFFYTFFNRVMEPLELARRWGLVCACCQANRHLFGGPKHSKCPRSSRRSREARRFLAQLISSFNQAGSETDLEPYEGNALLFNDTSLTLRKTGSEIKIKGKHFWIVPWLIVEGDDPVQAKNCVLQLIALPDDCDPCLKKSQ
jgi:hypothetical protein